MLLQVPEEAQPSTTLHQHAPFQASAQAQPDLSDLALFEGLSGPSSAAPEATRLAPDGLQAAMREPSSGFDAAAVLEVCLWDWNLGSRA